MPDLRLKLLICEQGKCNHSQTFYTPIKPELTFYGPISTLSLLVHAPFFHFLIFLWENLLDCFLILEDVFRRTNLKQFHSWSIFRKINFQTQHSLKFGCNMMSTLRQNQMDLFSLKIYQEKQCPPPPSPPSGYAPERNLWQQQEIQVAVFRQMF